MKKFIQVIALMLFLPVAEAVAQESKNDNGVWASLDMSKTLNKKWSIGAELDVRSTNSSKDVSRFGMTMEGGYKPLKWLKLGAGISFMRDHKLAKETEDYKQDGTTFNGYNLKTEYWRSKQRYFFDVAGKLKLGRFTLSLRERYQYTHIMPCSYNRIKIRGVISTEGVSPELLEELVADGDLIERGGYYFDSDDVTTEFRRRGPRDTHLLRSRISVEYNIPKIPLTPEVSYEIQNDFCDRFSFVKHRVTAGLDWNVTKIFGLSAGYVFQHEFVEDDTDEGNLHAFQVGAKIKF